MARRRPCALLPGFARRIAPVARGLLLREQLGGGLDALEALRLDRCSLSFRGCRRFPHSRFRGGEAFRLRVFVPGSARRFGGGAFLITGLRQRGAACGVYRINCFGAGVELLEGGLLGERGGFGALTERHFMF